MEDEYCFGDREHIEELWRDYQPYADSNFHDEAQREGNFHSRIWEMRLTVTLKRLGLDVQPNERRRGGRRGPDIKIGGGPSHLD